MSVSGTSVRHPIAVAMLFAALLLLGSISLGHLKIDLFPELNYPGMLIRTRYANAVPEEILESITRPIEEALGAAGSVNRISSQSLQGISIVRMDFHWGTNMDYAFLKVREKLDEIHPLLPETVERPDLLRLDPSSQPIMEIAITGSSLKRLTAMCRTVIRRRLEQIRGVAMVEVVGGVDSYIEVQANPRALARHHISFEQIAAALRDNNVSFTGGNVQDGQHRRSLRIDGALQSTTDIVDIALTSHRAGTSMRLGDIASVSEKVRERESITRLNGLETIGLLITKEAGSNTVAVSKSVERVMDLLQADFPDLCYSIVSQQADFIQNSIRNVLSSVMWGGILAFFALFIFLRSFAHPALIGASMPISVLSTFILMHIAGVSLNMMSLGGLALGMGMLVDNSIIVLENAMRYREEGMDAVHAAIHGTDEVSMPIVASTLTTCAVFLPLMFVRGIAGRLFRDLSLTVTIALLCSIMVAISLLPALMAGIRGKRTIDIPIRSEHRPHRAIALYRNALTYCLDHKRVCLCLTAVLLLLTTIAIRMIDYRIFPPIRSNETTFRLELPPGTSIYQTADVSAAFERAFMSDASVDCVFSHVGTQESMLQRGDVDSPQRGRIEIKLRKDAHIDIEEAEERLRRASPTQYAYKGAFERGDRLYRQLLGLLGSDIQIDVRGSDWTDLEQVAQHTAAALRSIDGFENVNISHRGDAPLINVSIRRDVAARHGISSGDIAEALKQHIQGLVATQIRQYDNKLDVVIASDPLWRPSWAHVVSQTIDVSGKVIPIHEFIEWRIASAPEELRREDQENVIHITASTPGLSNRNAIKRARRIIEQAKQSDRVRITFGARQNELSDSMRSLAWALALSIIMIYLILAAQFESFRYPLLILLVVPLSFAGGIWALLIAGCTVNVISGIGFIVLSGIAVNDAILLIAFMVRARREGATTRASIHEACAKRWRPILMTSVTTIVALLPVAMIRGDGADLRESLAVVLIGGLSASTVFTLIILPVAYELLSGTESVNSETQNEGENIC